jgi:hypothetical protein
MSPSIAAPAVAAVYAAERRSRSATQQRPGGNLQPRSLPGLNTGLGQKKENPLRNVNIKLPAMIPSQKPVQLRQKDKLVLLPRSASSSDAGETAAAAAASSQDGAAAAAAAARAALAQAAAAMAERDVVLDMSSMGQPAHLFEDLAQQVRLLAKVLNSVVCQAQLQYCSEPMAMVAAGCSGSRCWPSLFWKALEQCSTSTVAMTSNTASHKTDRST